MHRGKPTTQPTIPSVICYLRAVSLDQRVAPPDVPKLVCWRIFKETNKCFVTKSVGKRFHELSLGRNNRLDLGTSKIEVLSNKSIILSLACCECWFLVVFSALEASRSLFRSDGLFIYDTIGLTSRTGGLFGHGTVCQCHGGSV